MTAAVMAGRGAAVGLHEATDDASAVTVLETLAMNHFALGQVALGVAAVRQLRRESPERATRLLLALLAALRGGRVGLGTGMLASAAAPHTQSLGWQLAVELRTPQREPTVRTSTAAASRDGWAQLPEELLLTVFK